MSFICAICRDPLKISEDEQASHAPLAGGENTGASFSPLRLLPNGNNGSSVSPSKAGGRNRKDRHKSIVATKCGHLFHYPCLSVWLSQSVNLTSDSKMRCPSCKQLIYIYELIQLFPTENGCLNGGDLEHWFSTGFQQTLRGMLEQLESLCKDLSKKNNGSAAESPLMKGSETPTKLQRIRDSPKKGHQTHHQLAQLMKDVESLRGSIKELNQFMEQQREEMGSRLERQTKQISELRSKNEELVCANQRLQSAQPHPQPENRVVEEEREEALVVLATTAEATACRNNDQQKRKPDHREEDDDWVGNDDDWDGITKSCSSAAVEKPGKNGGENCKAQRFSGKEDKEGDSGENASIVATGKGKVNGSPCNKCPVRRKSVTFVDPFDLDPGFGRENDATEEGDKACEISRKGMPLVVETKDFRVGDKVVWSFEGSPEVGTVKWKGFIGSQIHVGVEFERQLGLPIKDLNNDALQCIFKCKLGHGRLIPVREVVLFNKAIFSNYPGSDHYFAGGKNSAGSGNNGINKRIHQCTHQ